MKKYGGGGTNWVGKNWLVIFPRGKNGLAQFFPGRKTDWGGGGVGIQAYYTGVVATADLHVFANGNHSWIDLHPNDQIPSKGEAAMKVISESQICGINSSKCSLFNKMPQTILYGEKVAKCHQSRL